MSVSRVPCCRSATASLLALAGLTAAARTAPAQQPAPYTAALRAGDSAWAAGGPDVAARHYATAIRLDSTGSAVAAERLAALAAERNRLGEAVALQRLYTRLEPGDVAGFTTLGRLLAWAGR